MQRWYGKLLGFIAGWLLLRHPAGGVIGALIGHAFDAGWLAPRRYKDHQVFGLGPEATREEIDQAYRKLISQYHPDKYADAAPELRAQAEARAAELNAAYDRLRRGRDGRKTRR